MRPEWQTPVIYFPKNCRRALSPISQWIGGILDTFIVKMCVPISQVMRRAGFGLRQNLYEKVEFILAKG
jgi:hypothetical protein